MKNFLKSTAIVRFAQRPGLPTVGFRLVATLALSFVAIANGPLLVAKAQKLDVPVTVNQISSERSPSETVVSIAADGSLSKAQTWQDNEGFHVVLPNTVSGDSVRTRRGIRVRKVGSSLELLLQIKPGTRVTVDNGHNQLNFVIDGKLEDPQYSNGAQNENSAAGSSSNEGSTGSSRPAGAGIGQATNGPGTNNGEATPPLISPNEIIPQNTPVTDPASSEIKIHDDDDGLLASVFSGTSILIVISLGLFGLLVSRRLSAKEVTENDGATLPSDKTGSVEFEGFEGTIKQAGNGLKDQKLTSLPIPGESGSSNALSRPSAARMPVAGPTSLYGAYRIDQEVGKLLLGQPHRIDVLASRAVDDRRAIEASLIKGVNSSDLEEKAQLRARNALEEYGFVARQCATLLLAPDAFERTSAARTLGEIKSPAALPFLLEGLYDSESIVRNQAVVSIGELRLPSAIGALLDIARTHPDVPSALLSRTLSACSVEGLDFFDAIASESSLLGSGLGNIIEEITHLEPASPVENLPASSDDENFVQALSLLEGSDVQMRSEALKTLVQFRVQRAVDAIAWVARHDPEPSIRSLAISSLGTINHESVFPTVLIGMADESREVRASAARSLNGLCFDRADAYVRVLETSNEETVRDVARACTQAGIVSQSLDRLANSDHRQAYEAFSLICLLSEANMNEPVLETILAHPNVDVRLKIVHLLARTGHPGTCNQLRELAVRDGMHEEVKTALLEAIYKLDQAKPKQDETPESHNMVDQQSLESSETESVEAQSLPMGPGDNEGHTQPNYDELEL